MVAGGSLALPGALLCQKTKGICSSHGWFKTFSASSAGPEHEGLIQAYPSSFALSTPPDVPKRVILLSFFHFSFLRQTVSVGTTSPSAGQPAILPCSNQR